MHSHVLAGEPQAVVVSPSLNLSPLLSIALLALTILLTATIAGRTRNCTLGRSLSWAVGTTSLVTIAAVAIGFATVRTANSHVLFNDAAALMFLIPVAIAVSAYAIIASLRRGAAPAGLLILGLATMLAGAFSALVGLPGSSTTHQPINNVRVSVNQHATDQAIAARDGLRRDGATSLGVGAALFITGAVGAGMSGRSDLWGDSRFT